MIKQKIAIVHLCFRVGGGSEAMPLWIIETLKRKYDLTLITMGHMKLDELNKAYGTDLKEGEFKIISIPIPFLFRKRFDALRGYSLARYCKKHAAEYDLMISTYNVMDFGRKGIQFIADFSFDDELRRKYDFSEHGAEHFVHHKSFIRSMYLKLGEVLSGVSKVGWKRNITIANSDWSGRVMKVTYGIDCKTIYPPVWGDFPDIPWESRENGFVVLARITPEKRIDNIIEILSKVRETNNDIHFHILGTLNDSAYGMKIRKLAEQNSAWIFLEGLVTGQKKTDFIARHKYSISGRFNEPFGIAVAEAVRAGCITWVPNGGGQTEIVNNPELICDNLDDAANKIEQVLRNKALQNALQIYLAEQSRKFSVEKFQSEIRELVHKFLNENA